MSIRKDCFAYHAERKECTALTKTFCKNENCKFYKTKEEYIETKKEAEKRAEENGKYRTYYKPLP